MKRILLITLLISQGIIFAQNESNFKIYESPVYIDKVKTDSVRATYTSNSGKTGIIRNDKKEIVFDLFDENFSKIHSKLIETDKKETYIGDIFYSNEINVFTETFPDKDVKVLTCYVFNLENKTNKKIELSSTTIDKKLSLFSNQKGAKFSMSPDLNYFSITNYTIHKDEVFYHVSVFDSKTYELVYDQQITRNENKFFSLSEIQIDNSKNVFLLGESFFDEESPKIKSEKNRHFIVEKISKTDYSKLDLNLENKYIKSLKAVTDANEYNLYGFYSDSGLNAIKGVCNILIDMENFEIKNKNLQDLPSQVYADLFGTDKADKKKGKELFEFKIDYILNDEQNNIYLTAEQFYITYENDRKVEHYDDILIIKFTPNGKLDWGRSILKYDYKPSYNAFVKNNELHIILNSGKKLKELNDGRTKATVGLFETSALYDFVYLNTGLGKINKIQNNKKKTYYLPNYGNYIDGKFIMISDSQKERQFMTLE
ncbi:hypothetical protein [Ulvibacter litoralis]|uniref:WG containing repeat-containing protein n=1 Tax=Ulvibacter litoralis TaxID=227084 RepID=A0A1G7JP28_9FLAO|nr:hypothetical protein [Ulvibacter litoralis]GHC65234.1 hypothetical protein GCM10008083_33120 [Ulvibacter litoralis]SDF26710.1 hypothetical protein SAMN05421855_1214 [Ulvibacter litoralis]